MQFPDARILIFAKPPIPGRVKTRLIPHLGEQQACELYRASLRYILRQRQQACLAPLVLCMAQEHAELDLMADHYGLARLLQQGADLGERMAHAANAVLRSHSPVFLTGSDTPGLSNHQLALAMQSLTGEVDVVMTPAEDGGYVLLGLRQPQPDLFVGIAWGSERVAQQTRERCRDLGLNLCEMPVSWDLDRPADLLRLHELDDAAEFAQHLPRL